jgi:outer membrane protein assembly factor BamB
VLWKLDTSEKFHVVQNFFGVGSTPVVEGDLLILGVGGSPAGSRPSSPDQLNEIKGGGSGIVALDKLTGAVKYQVTDELASYASPTVTTIAGRRWGFVFARGGLIGFEPASGKVDFEFPWRAKRLYSVNAATPVVVGDTVFISESYEIGAALLRAKPGGYDVVWKDPAGIRDPKAMRLHWNTPIAVDGFLYGSSGENSDDAELRCIDIATGKVKWSEPGLSRSSLLYVDGHFVCLTEYGHLHLLRATPEKYDAVANFVPKNKDKDAELGAGVATPNLLAYPAWAAPILAHGLLYVRGRDQLACFELIPAAK